MCMHARNAGVKFSYASYQSGRHIMVHRDHRGGMWVFLQPFEPAVWLLAFGSSVVVALTVLLLEGSWRLRRIGRGCAVQLPDMGDGQRGWETFLRR